MVLSHGIIVVGGFAIPLHGFCIICLYALTKMVTKADSIFSFGISLFSSLTKPFGTFRIVLSDAPSMKIECAEDILRDYIPIFCLWLCRFE